MRSITSPPLQSLDTRVQGAVLLGLDIVDVGHADAGQHPLNPSARGRTHGLVGVHDVGDQALTVRERHSGGLLDHGRGGAGGGGGGGGAAGGGGGRWGGGVGGGRRGGRGGGGGGGGCGGGGAVM